MSVSSSDLVYYGAANIAETDGVTQGGAIDDTVKYIFDSASLANSLADTIEVVSSSGADTTQTVTVTGRSAAGSIITEDFVLTGTTPVNGATTFERVLKVVIDGAHTGIITVRKATGDTSIGTLEPDILELRRPFYNVSADASGGSSRDYYEKVFLRNDNGVNALLDAAVEISADPSGNVSFDLEDAVNDNNSTADRLDTAPTGMLGSFSDTSKLVPGTDLQPGAAIGIWLKLTLAAGASPATSTFTLSASGHTT